MADNRFLDLNGLSYAIRKMDGKKADIESPVFTGTPTAPTPDLKDKSLKIANTEFVVNVASNYVLKAGDTMTGPLKFNTNTLPILDLHITNGGSNVYSLTTNGSLFVGDATSTGGARVYYARKVTQIKGAILSAVSVGYNPLDQANWSTSKDYGIKFDVNFAVDTTPYPSATRQCASFFVGVNGAVVGYSGSTTKALSADTIYNVIDSNNIKTNEYIKSLEQRIADLEAKLNDTEEEP